MAFLKTDEEILTVLGQLLESTILAVDTETTGLNPQLEEIRMVSLSVPPWEVGYSFFTKGMGAATKDALRELLKNPNSRKVGYNFKFDRHFLRQVKGALGGEIFDCYLLLRGLDENRWERNLNYKLKPTCAEIGLSIESADQLDDFLKSKGLHKGQMCLTFQELADQVNQGRLDSKGKPVVIPPALRPDFTKAGSTTLVALPDNKNRTIVPTMLLGAYAADDAVLTGKLFDYLVKHYELANIPWSFAQFKADTNDTAYQMEAEGIRVDLEFLDDYGKRLEAEAEGYKEQILPYTQREELKELEGEFNPSSLDHLSLLLKAYGFPGTVKTSSGKDQLNREALEAWDHPLGELILKYRRCRGLLGTFVEGIRSRAITWPGLKEGVVHTEYNVGEARTGRWSSSNPNMQNIDKKSETRKAFIVPKGCALALLDFSQIEPRVTAAESKDENLLKAFREGWDYHTFNASLMLNKPYASITKDERAFCKAPGLATGYGAGAAKLAKMLGKSIAATQAFLKEYKDRLPAVKKLTRETQETIENTAWRCALRDGSGSHEGGDPCGAKLYENRLIPYRFQPKRKGLPVLIHGAQPQRFAWKDKWNDADYWAFLDMGGTSPTRGEDFTQISDCQPGYGWYEQNGMKWGGLPQYGEIRSTRFPGAVWRFRPRNARLGFNTRIQGTAGLLLEAAIARIKKQYGYIPILQIHDEIGYLFPLHTWEKQAIQCKQVMEGMTDLLPEVPIKVDVAATMTSWYDEQEYELVEGVLRRK